MQKKKSKAAKCKAEQLLEKSENLCQEAKCLYKQAEETQAQAQENCEQAKCIIMKSSSS